MAKDEQGIVTAVTLADWRVEGLHHTLTAYIKEGDLVIDGCDFGTNVQETWGDSDYEYSWTVPGSHKDMMLLLLLKERFASSSEWTKHDSLLKEWLDGHAIPTKFWYWI